jgi:hypothetical protein
MQCWNLTYLQCLNFTSKCQFSFVNEAGIPSRGKVLPIALGFQLKTVFLQDEEKLSQNVAKNGENSDVCSTKAFTMDKMLIFCKSSVVDCL